MMKRYNFMAILFAFAMQSATMWSTTTSVYPVNLIYRPTGNTGANPKPSKTPPHYTVPLGVFLNEESQQLLISSMTDGEFTYYIYNEANEVITQGTLSCSNNGEYTIDLALCCIGEYTLAVINNDHEYRGVFEIN